jgi:hypothetical protein
MNKLTGIEFKVVGVSFDDEVTGLNRQIFLQGMTMNDAIRLQREPQNRFDTNAVAVIYNDSNKIGYVGKQYAQVLAPLMDQDRVFTAKIQELNKYKGAYYCKILVDEV